MVLFKKSKLLHGIETGDEAAVRKMLDHGVNPNWTDSYGRSFLYHAVSRGNRDAAALLLAYGAKVSTEVRRDGTLLHAAARKGSVEIATLLLEKEPALLDMKDRDGNTPLHEAAESGYAEMAAFLVGRGADPNQKNYSNRTPLFLAIRNNNAQAAEFLRQCTQETKLPFTPDAPAAETPAAASAEWKKLSGERVARVTQEDAIGYRITEIFNFQSRERTTLYQNLETKAETAETRAFAQVGDRAGLEEALAEFRKQGGRADSAVIGGIDKPGLQRTP